MLNALKSWAKRAGPDWGSIILGLMFIIVVVLMVLIPGHNSDSPTVPPSMGADAPKEP